MFTKQTRQDLFPHHHPDIKVHEIDDQNYVLFTWHGLPFKVQFHSPWRVKLPPPSSVGGQVFYKRKAPGRTLQTVWDNTEVEEARFHVSVYPYSTSFMDDAITTYRNDVLDHMEVQFHKYASRILRANRRYNLSRTHKAHTSLLVLVGPHEGGRARFLLGYSFTEDVFYARYSIDEEPLRSFDSNEGFEQVLIDMFIDLSKRSNRDK